MWRKDDALALDVTGAALAFAGTVKLAISLFRSAPIDQLLGWCALIVLGVAAVGLARTERKVEDLRRLIESKQM